MATSSIFRTPQFNTEESVRSLVEAIEATMADPTDYRSRALEQVEYREVKDSEEIRKFFGVIK